MNSLTEMLVTVFTLTAGVALAAVLVSRNSQTPAVAQSIFSGYSNALDTAISPVTGSTTSPNLNYPSQPDFSAGFST